MVKSVSGDDELNSNDSKIIAQALETLVSSHKDSSERIVRLETNYENFVTGVGEMSGSIKDLAESVNKMAMHVQSVKSDTTNIEKNILNSVNHIEEKLEGYQESVDEHFEKHDARIDVLETGFQTLKLLDAEQKGYQKGSGAWSSWFATNWFKLISLLVMGGTAIYTVTKYFESIPKS